MNPAVMRAHFWRLLCLAALGALPVLATHALAAGKVLEAGHLGNDPVSLTHYFDVLEDPSLALTLADVQQPDRAAQFNGDQAPAVALSYGFTPSAYWLRLHLRNTSDQPVDRLLEIAYARLSHIQFHQPAAEGPDAGTSQTVTSGLATPFATRPYANRFFVFPLRLPAHSDRDVFLRVQSAHPLAVPGQLWAPQAFARHERNDYLAQAWYFGMASAMILFNLLLYVALRDVVYVLYIDFVVCTALTVAAQNGQCAEFLWLGSSWWSDIAVSVGYALGLATLLMFMRHMLDTVQRMPRIDRLLKWLVGVLLLTPIGLAISYASTAKLAAVLYLAVLFLILGVCLYGIAKRQRSAYFFGAAFAMIMLGAVMSGLRSFGLLPTNMLTVNGIQFGSALEMILLAFALADRFNQVRQEKAQAQAAALQAQNETLLAQAEAQRAQSEAMLAQNQLVQSEKMAALGQLIAGVTHEINTPIGAIKSSGQSISEALTEALANQLKLFRTLDAPSMERFLALIKHGTTPVAVLNSREERAVVRETTRQLEEAGIADARQKADLLVQLNVRPAEHSVLNEYLPLLRHAECELILETAGNMAAIIGSAHNVNTAVDRVAKIVLALKSFSRVGHTVEFIDADLSQGLDTVLTIYNYQIKQGIEVVRNYQDIAPLRCLPDELNQVWTNLIHNALQAMDHKGTLTVGIRRDGDDAVVSIGDSGSGIPAEIRSKIFEVFFTTKPTGEGSGLGLDIVRKIVEKHRGRIEVHSEVGVGTTFLVYLPYTTQAL